MLTVSCQIKFFSLVWFETKTSNSLSFNSNSWPTNNKQFLWQSCQQKRSLPFTVRSQVMNNSFWDTRILLPFVLSTKNIWSQWMMFGLPLTEVSPLKNMVIANKKRSLLATQSQNLVFLEKLLVREKEKTKLGNFSCETSSCPCLEKLFTVKSVG